MDTSSHFVIRKSKPRLDSMQPATHGFGRSGLRTCADSPSRSYLLARMDNEPGRAGGRRIRGAGSGRSEAGSTCKGAAQTACGQAHGEHAGHVRWMLGDHPSLPIDFPATRRWSGRALPGAPIKKPQHQAAVFFSPRHKPRPGKCYRPIRSLRTAAASGTRQSPPTSTSARRSRRRGHMSWCRHRRKP